MGKNELNDKNIQKQKIEVVSLFSGIGGFEEGLKKSKIESKIVFSSEIDENARISYISNFGNKNLYGDITVVDEKDIPNHDLLMAGFPCQSFSIAGKRMGFEDIRGTLFFDVARILKEKKPKYILLENVKNLVSHDKGETVKKILWTLNTIGYTVDFTVINSNEAGVPQNRDRTYICGIYGQDSEKFEDDIRNAKVTCLKRELNLSEFKGFNFFNRIKFSTKKRYIEDILEPYVDDRYYFSSSKVVDYLKDIEISECEKKQPKIIKLFDLPKDIHNDLERQRRVYSVKGISPTVLARSDSTKICVKEGTEYRVRKVTPVENFYIQGFGNKFVENIKATGMSATQMYKQSGNAVSPPVITGILNHLYDEHISNN